MQHSTATLDSARYKGDPLATKGSGSSIIGDIGFRILFFLIIYVILVIKIASSASLNDHILFSVYSLLITVYILSRFLLSYLHRSDPLPDGYEPSVSFVVPAKNEGDNIAATLRCFFLSDYPKDKMEVIAINDGSSDNTLEEMLKVQAEYGHLIKRFDVVDWEVNRGKREGMAAGGKMAKNDIVIFVDSDSFIRPDCIKHLVK